jgi:hypothetical protein
LALSWNCRNSRADAANRHCLEIAGIQWQRHRIGTDLDRNSTTEAANRHCLGQEFDDGSDIGTVLDRNSTTKVANRALS